MARFKEIASGRSDLFMLDPNLIVVDPGWNVRIKTEAYFAGIRELADSIKSEGVKEPLRGFMRGDDPVLTNGHRRLDAVMLAISEGAEIKAVPFLPEDRNGNDADRVMTMLTSNSGAPLLALEKAEVFKRLMNFGWDIAKIATKSGISGSQVRNILDLGAAPSAVQAIVTAGEISATTAVAAVREHGDGAAEVLGQAVAKAKERGSKKATARDFAPAEGRLLDAAKKAFDALSDDDASKFRAWIDAIYLSRVA